MASDPKADAALALHRFGVSPRPGSIAAIASDPRGALLADLDRAGAGRIPDADLLPSGPACARGICLPGGATRGPARRTRHAAGQCARHRRLVTGHETGGSTVRAGQRPDPIPVLACRSRFISTKPRRASMPRSAPRSASPSGWSGSGRTISAFRPTRAVCARSAGAFEREAIRAHVLGRFGDMLLAVEIPSGDADLSRQCALDRSRTRPPACGRSAASTKISPARSSSCIRSACAASTPRTTSPGSPM